jgi:hypothetical protein
VTTASGNLPRFLNDTLPEVYAETVARRARLMADLAKADEFVAFLRRVAIAAGVDLDNPVAEVREEGPFS